ncbi:MAG: hypothetical protein JO277_00725, partial [Candidatus Eremiobacteraeota bacterium]|nr:hypothetical protein [Candidatus Eremiobacteraeota bacterium]
MSASSEIVDMTPFVDVYEDPTASQDVGTVAATGRFEPVARIALTHPQSTYWLRFRFS